jgi:O-methyltransferase
VTTADFHFPDEFPEVLRRFPEDTEIRETLAKVRPYTMVFVESLVDLADQVAAVLEAEISGAFVECGVWRGGSSFLMAELLRQAGAGDRKVWMFDSFEGIPAPKEIDGEAALEWGRTPENPWYFDNLRASIEDVRRTAADLGLTDYTKLVKGYFEVTLPATRAEVGPIAILRIDADWYDSVRCCLENLYDQVVDDGFIVIDDYFSFEGCSVAVHEFLGKRRISWPIESVIGKREEDWEAPQTAIIRKGGTTWSETRQWLRRLRATTREIGEIVPPGESLILVDGQHATSPLPLDRRAVPLDAATTDAVGALMNRGASFLVFRWPALWWLDYYPDLTTWLRTSFACVLENERLVVFDLRRTL